MKKFLSGLFTVVIAFVFMFSLSGCAEKHSATTVDTSKVASTNGVSTNGGITVIYDGYLYFVNGTKDNDGTSSEDNTRGGIARVKINTETGEIDTNTYELLVEDLVGYDNGSMYFFGNYIYYTSPSADVNYKGEVLYYKTRFKRYDLVNKNTQTIYTTNLNSEDEVISFAYYVTGTELNLVVYETSNQTLTSIKIGDTFKTNYVIEGVRSCVLSENYGTCETENATVDANSFVYYTLANNTDGSDRYQQGVKVYRTLPNKNESVLLSNKGYSISLLSIRNSKLIFSYESRIYAQAITGSNNEELNVALENVISYKSYEDVIFVENDDGSISVLYYNNEEDDYHIAVVNCVNGKEITTSITNILSESENFALVDLVTLEEVITEDDPETEDVDETVTETVKYLIYVEDGAVYKIEIEREGVLTNFAQPIKLTDTEVVDPTGILIPEVVGNYIYIFAEELDEDDKGTDKFYLYRADITIDNDSTEYATLVGIKED